MTLYPDFFQTATGHQPYLWQCRLACGEPPEDANYDLNNPDQPTTLWLSGGADCESKLIDIPTGLGKTAGVVLAWLWNHSRPAKENNSSTLWPRRLVYCLPMRTLVEQTRDETKEWIKKLSTKYPISVKPRVVVLMGGESLEEDEKDWDLYPEAPTILIGTQDMLLSRALNRGYGMSRARWPMHFALLNNDALWVLDETQLIGVGVQTSAQLEGLRQSLGLAANSQTWWASATLDTRLLQTPDHTSIPSKLTLDDADLATDDVRNRIHSTKHLFPIPLSLEADTQKAKKPYLENLAEQVLSKHQQDGLTLVILNRVDRARELYKILEKQIVKNSPPLLLVHSRFRQIEREPLTASVKAPGEKIIISTQAIEAGLDISARILITELAPWSSLIQRFGRCNRKGEFNSENGAEIHWIDLHPENERDAADLALPYTPQQLDTARSLLKQLLEQGNGASPAALAKLKADEPLPESHILRRKDLIDLFDTTPDLAGLDLDVGRYIRDGDERDVQVFWRTFPKDSKVPNETITADHSELVSVPAHEFKKFANQNKGSIWFWDPLEGRWQELRDTYRIAPGKTFLVDQKCSGYSETLGWTGAKEKKPFRVLSPADSLPVSNSPRDGQNTDDESQTSFQSLSEHTARVIESCEKIIQTLPNEQIAPFRETILTAARWHDIGKTHPVFQEFLTAKREIPPKYQSEFLAKSEYKPGIRHSRRYFRHELASVLAWLQSNSTSDILTQNLVAWLIITHHGKIRLSLRSMPNEPLPQDETGTIETERLHARGIWQGDQLADSNGKQIAIDGIPESLPPLDLSLMQMGGTPDSPSWTTRALSLRDNPELGIFRLTWLETLLRAADARASKAPTPTSPPTDP